VTISSQTNKAGPSIGNGVTTVFGHNFRIANETHIKVISKSALGVETVLTLTTHYTVQGVGDQTGKITMLVAPATGTTLTRIRNVPFTQGLDLQSQGAYNAEDVETAFDASVSRDQQLQEQVDRSVKLPASADSSGLDTLVANINSLAGVSTSVATVAGIAANVTTVAGIAAGVSAVADVAAAVGASPANAAAAAASAAAAALSEAAADADRVTVAADKATVAADKATVAADKATVAADKATVAADKGLVNTAKGLVDTAKAATDANVVLTAADVVLAEAAKVAAEAAAAGTTTVPVQIAAASAVAFADGDHLPARAVSGGALIKATWSDVKTAIGTALGGLINAFTAKTTPVDADIFAIADSAASNASRKVTWANIKATLNAYFGELGSLALVAGDILYASGSNTLQRLAKGTNGHVLTLAAGVPSWSLPAAGGMTLLGTLTTTSGTTQSITGIADGYRTLYCEIEGVSHNNNASGRMLQVALSINNGSSYGTARAITAIIGLPNTDVADGVVEVLGISTTNTAAKMLLPFTTATGGLFTTMVQISATASGVIDAIQFSLSSGASFDAGTIRVYGVK